MSTILEKPIRVNRIVTTSIEHARAIEDPIRAKIIEILYNKIMSADQIHAMLEKEGYNKALTTIRHHLDVLKESKLIEVVKIEEVRGAITKYYGTTTKLLGFQIPDDFEAKYSKTIKTTSAKVQKILQSLISKTTDSKEKNSEEYSQYIVMEILNRAVTNVLEDSTKS